MEHWNICAQSYILTGQIPVSVKTIWAFVGQFSPTARRSFPICYPPCQHSGGFLLSKCYSRHLAYWQMIFPAFLVSPSAVFLSVSFPQKSNDHILITPTAGRISFLVMNRKIRAVASAVWLRHWWRFVVFQLAMRLGMIKKKNNRYSLEWAFGLGWMAADSYSRECGILQDKPAVSTHEPRILIVLSAASREEKCTRGKKT